MQVFRPSHSFRSRAARALNTPPIIPVGMSVLTKLGRRGSFKFAFGCSVHEVTLEKGELDFPRLVHDSPCAVVLKRGSKLACTREGLAADGMVSFGEELSLVCTMQRELARGGAFAQKRATFTFVQARPGRPTSSGRPLGRATLDLSAYAGVGEVSEELTLPLLRSGKRIGTLRCTLSSRWLRQYSRLRSSRDQTQAEVGIGRETEDDDDCGSEASFMSYSTASSVSSASISSWLDADDEIDAMGGASAEPLHPAFAELQRAGLEASADACRAEERERVWGERAEEAEVRMRTMEEQLTKLKEERSAVEARAEAGEARAEAAEARAEALSDQLEAAREALRCLESSMQATQESSPESKPPAQEEAAPKKAEAAAGEAADEAALRHELALARAEAAAALAEKASLTQELMRGQRLLRAAQHARRSDKEKATALEVRLASATADKEAGEVERLRDAMHAQAAQVAALLSEKNALIDRLARLDPSA